MKASKKFIFAALLVLLPGACVFIPPASDKASDSENKKEEVPPPSPDVVDSISLRLIIRPVCPFEYKIGRVDYFLYSDRLLGHYKSLGEDVEVKLDKAQEPGRLYVLANCFGEFNEQALWHYDNFESLILDIRNEKPGYPILSGSLEIPKDTPDTVVVDIKALSSEIKIRSISNLSNDFSLLENPRMYLRNAYYRARPFGKQNISTGEYYETERIYLQYDIGIYTQYPDIRLYCYPDDIPESNITPATELVLEYEKDGSSKEKIWRLYPLERNESRILDLDI